MDQASKLVLHLPKEVDARFDHFPGKSPVFYRFFSGRGAAVDTQPLLLFCSFSRYFSRTSIHSGYAGIAFGDGISPAAGDRKKVLRALNCSGIGISSGGGIETTEKKVSTGGVCGR